MAARVLARIAFGACTLLVAGCGRDGRESASATPNASSPRRIVALTVGSVDTLARLGQLDRVVAVEEDCFVPGTEHLVKIRNDDHSGPSKALNVEAVMALRPDLVVAKEDLRPALEHRGIEVMWLPSASGLDDVAPLVEELGARLECVERAREVVAAMRAKMATIEARVASLPRVRVYYEAGKAGRTMGQRTVVDSMIRLAGGVNVAGDSTLANPTLSSEAIVAADPEVIVLSPWSDSPEDVARRPGWDRIAAVRHGRVHRLTERERTLQYPSPSCVDGCASMLVPWLHPELATSMSSGTDATNAAERTVGNSGEAAEPK